MFAWLWSDPMWLWLVTALAKGGKEGCWVVGLGILEVSSCSVPSLLLSRIVFLLELIRSEAQVVVSIGKIKGVPDPSTLQELEVDTKAAAITYSYCVTYEFAEGEEVEDGGSAEVGV